MKPNNRESVRMDSTTLTTNGYLKFAFALSEMSPWRVKSNGYERLKIITSKKAERVMAAYFSIGAICFLALFSGVNVVASITKHWEILQYSLFGMPIFMAFLAYLIVRYKAFNISVAIGRMVACILPPRWLWACLSLF